MEKKQTFEMPTITSFDREDLIVETAFTLKYSFQT